MTAVEYFSKSGPYCCQVWAGAFASEPLTGKNNSVGLRTTCTVQFTAAQTATSETAASPTRTDNGAARSARRARRARLRKEIGTLLQHIRYGHLEPADLIVTDCERQGNEPAPRQVE